MKIGVVVSAYRRYHFLPQAIESVLKQTRKADEIVVVVDDAEKIKRYPVYIVESKAEKYGEMLIAGIKALTTDVVAFLEDDDLFHPEKLKIIEKVLKNNDIVALHHRQHFIDFDGHIIDDSNIATYYLNGQPSNNTIVGKENALDIVKKFPLLHHNVSSWVIKKHLLEYNVEILSNIELMLDYAFLVISILHSHFTHIGDQLSYYRIGSGHSQLLTKSYNEVAKVVCVRNRYAIDSDWLLSRIKDPIVRNIVLRNYIDHAKFVYLFNTLFSCNKTYKISLMKLSLRLLEGKLKNIHPVSWRTIALLIVSPIIGTRRIAKRSLAKMYGISI